MAMPALQLNRQNVLKNIATLFSGSAIANAMTILTLLLIARHFGAEDYGRYSSSLALASLSSIVFNLGLDIWLLREGGRRPAELKDSLGSVLVIKSIAGLPWFGILATAAPLINQQVFPADLIRLLAVTVWVDSLFATALTAFKASLRNRFTSILEAGSDAIWLLGTLLLIVGGNQDLNDFVYVRIVVLLGSVILALALLHRTVGIQGSKSTAKQAIREAFPYASSEFLAWASSRADVVIVGIFLGQYAAGIYSPAVGIVNGLFLVPAAVYMVMLPVLSNLYMNNPVQAKISARRTISLLTLIGLLLSVTFALIAPLLVSFLSESFLESLDIMRILSIILLLKSISYAMAAILVANGQQSRRTIVQAAAVGLNIALNLLVISKFGVTGVAVVYVITELVLLAGYSWLVYRQEPGRSEAQPVIK
jgi:O-antigen/teichoic acid export membrane protein